MKGSLLTGIICLVVAGSSSKLKNSGNSIVAVLALIPEGSSVEGTGSEGKCSVLAFPSLTLALVSTKRLLTLPNSVSSTPSLVPKCVLINLGAFASHSAPTMAY